MFKLHSKLTNRCAAYLGGVDEFSCREAGSCTESISLREFNMFCTWKLEELDSCVSVAGRRIGVFGIGDYPRDSGGFMEITSIAMRMSSEVSLSLG
mmetsp:Transcript_11663/g.23739  ORF Transcript_11663/g.23739 Transcript_11663/m.23739 type:complete len:96 (+) Transcript_11663:7071-7358(+)